ncbi:DUF4232 domain-containing protein [Saccharothrix yanglingensis]|uniref:Peptidase C14, caspase catalytic subunit P20 n=1 Tax=Saccharothrix yanglingensis TaxID=659496 RepID=A0ABU0X1U1_9PSEU|nr:DUF4232 domain-containing protein [Saccharothrix yanglingensis]MDQ2584539.1 peptidase C14, caspase catalytic subunit P20 [Saccharothrix yanglingensis]
MRRPLAATAAVGALAVVLSACGGGARPAANESSIGLAPPSSDATTGVAPVPPSSPTTQPPATDQATAGPASNRCTAAVLAGEVRPTDAAAGNRYAKLVVTNNGTTPCTLNGYSGLQLLDAAGQPVPTDLEREADPGPSRVVLPPKAQAAANLHWTVVATGDEPVERPCEPEAARAAAIPPDETQPMTLDWHFGPVCAGGRIAISAFYAA